MVTQVSPKYGDEHLDHLGVPRSLRSPLPLVKASTIAALVVTAKHSRPRSIVGAGLVSYYSAAVTFHVRAGDPPSEAVPAAICALLAATLV